jgi:predicted transcriptional regulator
MLKDRENILKLLREKTLKIYEIMKRANLGNEEACQSLLLKMRDEGLVKFDIHQGRWLTDKPQHLLQAEITAFRLVLGVVKSPRTGCRPVMSGGSVALAQPDDEIPVRFHVANARI